MALLLRVYADCEDMVLMGDNGRWGITIGPIVELLVPGRVGPILEVVETVDAGPECGRPGRVSISGAPFA